MKKCRVCEIEQPEDQFEVIKQSGNRRKVCRTCKKSRWEELKSSNPERYAQSRRMTILKFKYGLTVEEYDKLLDQQGNVCAVCGSTPTGLFHVDHDHTCCDNLPTCGRCVRGLLCGSCNSGLGMLKDDPQIVRKALAYLER